VPVGPPRLLMLRAGLPGLFQEFIGLPFRFGLGDAAALLNPADELFPFSVDEVQVIIGESAHRRVG
jgi:hypothetical protein